MKKLISMAAVVLPWGAAGPGWDCDGAESTEEPRSREGSTRCERDDDET